MTFRSVVVWLSVFSTVLSARPARAQEHPVVFVHGLRSSPHAWWEAAERLRQRASIAPMLPLLDWQSSYASQGHTLATLPAYAALPSATTVAVGHSNGGIVAREWSRHRSLSGIVTLGTPHAGAPLVSRFGEWAAFASATSSYVGLVANAFSRPNNTSWVIGNLQPALGWALGYGQSVVADLAVSLAIDHRLPVMADMRPGSGYLTSLNSQANLHREAAAVPRRVGIFSVAHNYYWAGPMRAAAPDAADTIAVALYGTIATLDFWAAWILAHADHGDPQAIQQAQSLFSLSAHLASIDPIYCALISSVDSSQCHPNDGVVPHTSQRYPNALNIMVETNGAKAPAHTQLTYRSDDTLYRTLVEVMHVPVRPPTPPPPPPPPTEPPPPNPPPGSEPGGTHDGAGQSDPGAMLPDDVLRPGESVYSQDERFELVYQGDGNLVLYHAGRALWASGTDGTAPGRVVMQRDGNFVMYDANSLPIWSSEGSLGFPGAWLLVQNDGNVVIYTEAGEPLWDTGTVQ